MKSRSRWAAAAVVMACAAAGLLGGTSTRAAELPAIDFSLAGYGGGTSLPSAPTRGLLVRPTGGDDTALLQAALDTLAKDPAGPDGFRGTLLLAAGTFKVAGGLQVGAGGIVIRGSAENGGTRILATGHSRRTLIDIRTEAPAQTAAPLAIRGETVPVGATTVELESVEGLAVGDRIVVTRPSPREWIAALEMNKAPGSFADMRLHWLPDSRNLAWDRTITAVDAASKRITFDAPLTAALERRFGGGTVAKVAANAPLQRVGVEFLTLESETAPGNARDEEHAWIAVKLDRVEDAWVRNVTARHFAGSAVRVGSHARRVTVENCRFEAPVSEVAGYRREAFMVEGQQVLVRGCFSEGGDADFGVGLCAAGPNVFLDCTTKGSLGASGSLESWAAGALFENVTIDGHALRLPFDTTRRQGAGWTAANSVLLNCKAAAVEAKGHETAPNVVIAQGPALYETQLKARGLTLEKRVTMVPAIAGGGAFRDFSTIPAPPELKPGQPPLAIVNGYFTIGKQLIWGGQVNEGWWRGQANPASALAAGNISLTRWVPGHDEPGMTEDLPRLANKMIADETRIITTGPGLWYDRRRDEHSITRREDGNVWAPFYEMPWARSGDPGKGMAWDGLTKFDLTTYNTWYYDRLHAFASLATRHGIVVMHNLHNTHNVLEIPPHWIDYPWRPANNINNLGPDALPEPPPIEQGNRLHVGNEYYRVNSPVMRDLHRRFILHELDVLGNEPNVIFSTAFQFVGPLEFQQFFQDTVPEWEKSRGKPPGTIKIALTTTKDITDAILADPMRSKQISVVDMRYWQYRPDGSLFAPAGNALGKGNLAFREMIGKAFGTGRDYPPNTTPEQAYRQVREYKDKYPHLALVAWHNDVGPLPALMAGAAQVLLRNPSAGHGQGLQVDRHPTDAFIRDRFGGILTTMKPRDGAVTASEGAAWCLADEAKKNLLIYSTAGDTLMLQEDLGAGKVDAIWVDPAKGEPRPAGELPLRSGTLLKKPGSGAWLLALQIR
jgi:hypothetical protein